MTIEAFAPAKINLTLHVTGQRADGYHLLDSLVMLANVGDRIYVSKSARTSLTVTGPMARGVPTDKRNLVWKAADLLGVAANIQLVKNLPSEAGIGGGSSDAAATVRALTSLYNIPIPSTVDLLTLGADVPVCMANGVYRMQGIGDELEFTGAWANWPMLLVNPGVGVPTGAVFSGLSSKDNTPMPAALPDPVNGDEALSWLAQCRNDLEAPARELSPAIERVLAGLEQSEGCYLARMSGSGATCFGIFKDDDFRDRAAARIAKDYPDWWVQSCEPCGVEFS